MDIRRMNAVMNLQRQRQMEMSLLLTKVFENSIINNCVK